MKKKRREKERGREKEGEKEREKERERLKESKKKDNQPLSLFPTTIYRYFAAVTASMAPS